MHQVRGKEASGGRLSKETKKRTNKMKFLFAVIFIIFYTVSCMRWYMAGINDGYENMLKHLNEDAKESDN